MRSGFFDNVEVVARDFARFSGGILTNGVLADDLNTLKISAAGGMQISAAVGYCWINGHYGVAEAVETLTIDTASGSLGRIDRVVARLDESLNSVYLAIIKGAEAAEPTPPSLVRDGTYYDLCLAQISVPAGTLAITSALITDTRSDATLCGAVLARTADLLALDGKADKTTVEAMDVRLTAAEDDIDDLQARKLTIGSLFSGTGGSSITVDTTAYRLFFVDVEITVTFVYSDPEYSDTSETEKISLSLPIGSATGFVILKFGGTNATTSIGLHYGSNSDQFALPVCITATISDGSISATAAIINPTIQSGSGSWSTAINITSVKGAY